MMSVIDGIYIVYLLIVGSKLNEFDLSLVYLKILNR